MTARRSIAVLFSEATRAELAAHATRSGGLYRCRAARGRIEWVVGSRAYLAPYGVLGALRRLGLPADLIGEVDVRGGGLDAYGGLVVADAAYLPPDLANIITAWLRGRSHSMIAAGACPGLDGALGVRRLRRVQVDGVVGVDIGRERVPIAGPGAEIDHVEPGDDAKAVGRICMMRPWRTEPDNAATITPLHAAVVTERSLYLAVPIFEHLGGALQGHVDVEALRDVFARRGLAGLEDGVRWLAELMDGVLPAVPWQVRIPPWGHHAAALVVRHDTDHSRDAAHLDYEVRERIPATYAVLPDANRQYWLDRLRPHPHLEAAFHYRTNVESRLGKLLRRAKGYVPDPGAVSGRGLVRQTAAARSLGIPIGTLHRHASFFFYPESVAGLDAVAQEFPDVVGTGSMFRWTLYRYGDAPFSQAVTVLHPETSVPFWMPFKPVVAARDGHTIVRAWESTHLIEPDPPMLRRVFAHADAMPGGAYVVGYHPAHATAPTFTPDGNFPWFASCIAEARRRDWWLATCHDLYTRLTGWEQLAVAVDTRGVRVENRSPQVFRDLVVSTAAGSSPMGDLLPGGDRVLPW